MRSDIATMLSHLRKCPLQPLDVTEWASREYATKYARSSRLSAPFTPSLMVPSTSLHPSPSHQAMQNTLGLPFHQFSPSPYHPQPMLSPQLSPLHMSPAMIINVPTPLPHPSETNALGFIMQESPNSSSGPPSRPTSGMSLYPQGLTISRPQSQQPRSFDQQGFGIHIGRMTVAAGLPLSWTDNPEVRSVFQMFFPWAQLPSRKTLSRSILPALQSGLRAQAQKETKGSNCTLQCDGWTAMSMHHLIAFMITVWPKVRLDTGTICYHDLPLNQIHSIRVHDAHGQEKNAENLLELLFSVIEEVRTEWGANVVAVCSDASGESRKARRLLREKLPHLVTLDCYAHQVCKHFRAFFSGSQSTDQPHRWRLLQMQLGCSRICRPC